MKELTKEDTKFLKGIAILFMLGLHLYNRNDTTGYYSSLLILGEYPWIYYVSFLFDACVPIYCFCAGYAAYLNKYKKNIGIIKLLNNYWIILLLTCLLGIAFKHESIPGNIFNLLGNIFLYDISYVGAWWFMQTYILLTLSSKYMIKIIEKVKPYIVIAITVFIYVISYYYRMMNPIKINIYCIDLISNALVLYGTTLLPYVLGIYFNKYKIVTTLRNINIKHKNVIGVLLIILCIALHNIIKSMAIPPIIAIIFICSILIMNINQGIRNIFIYFGNHSTNIWLVHMQFYMIFFKQVVFCTDTVIGCFIILLGLSLLTSHITNNIMDRLYNVSVKS